MYLMKEGEEIVSEKWLAHRELTRTINLKIEEMLNKSRIGYSNISGVVVFEGPGSFTGLRIGMTVANSFAYSLNIPVVSAGSKTWIKKGTKKLLDGKNEKISIPKYGSDAHVSVPKK